MKVLLFDIDGTLLLSGASGQEAIKLAAKQVFDIAEPAQVEVHGCTDRGIAGELFQAHDLENSDENFVRFTQCYLEHLEVVLPERPGQLMPNVETLLQNLSNQPGLHLGLLTGNLQRGATLKLQQFKLDHYFAFGGFGDIHPDRNDVAKEAKLQAESHLETPLKGEDIWVIGDTPNDIRCGRAIGAKVMAVATGKSSLSELESHQPDIALPDLSQAEDFLLA